MEKILEWDRALLHLVNKSGANPWFDFFFPAVTDLHKTLIFNLVIFPLFLGLFYWKYKQKGFVLFFGLLLCIGVSDLAGAFIKRAVHRTRPGDTRGLDIVVRSPYGGTSFISNHSSNMFALATYTSFYIPVVAVPSFAVAVIVAYSRVYNGVHFPLDVIMGGLLGVSWGFVFATGFRKILSRMKKA
jgi:undecaprenyl-diphosphatase